MNSDTPLQSSKALTLQTNDRILDYIKSTNSLGGCLHKGKKVHAT